MMNDQHQQLASALKQAAQASRPEFSESLHARIRRAINQQQAAPATRRPTSPPLRRLAYGAMAMAALLGLVLAGWWITRPAAPGPELAEIVEPDPQPEPLATIADQATQQMRLLVGATLDRQQWAYLDHDVQLATRLLLQQLPLFTAPNEAGQSPAGVSPAGEADG